MAISIRCSAVQAALRLLAPSARNLEPTLLEFVVYSKCERVLVFDNGWQSIGTVAVIERSIVNYQCQILEKEE